MLPIFHKVKILVVVLLLLLGLLVIGNSSVFAQDTLLGWQFDPQVTEVGKNAERARQLVYWLFTHSPSYSVPVFVSIWSISRNIVFVMFILVIAFTGLAYIISKRSGAIGPVFSGISSPIFGISVPTLFFRIGVLLLYVVFSYLIVIGLVQSGEIFSRFFAERYYGCDLFNIRFTGEGTGCDFSPAALQEMEANYTDFVGYRDPNILNQEAANTSLFLVRLTALTYNLFAIVLILRQVILWFLLMASPFLAILMPFVFIRNTGWIWIGVFFQWLFYGPLVSLFLAGLVLIWQNGIPYPFNFYRVNQTDGQVFPTSINILYGGPGQLLSPTNSANYVDTYAEYIIALVMLWTCIFLPWLLLRIFRDYCCDILRQNQGVLLSILDKIRGLGPQPPSTPGLGPLGTTQTAMQLPFRKSTEDLKKTSIERLREVSKVNTSELTRSLSLSISTLTEVARYEMNKQTQSNTITTLNKIANPYSISQSQDRDRYVSIRKELEERAHQGDRLAQQVIAASLKKPGHVTPVPLPREIPEITEHEAYNNLTKVSQLTTDKVREIIKEFHEVTHDKNIEKISEKLAVPQIKVEQVISSLPSYAPRGADATGVLAENPTIAGEIAKNTGVSEEKVREIIKHFSQTTLSQKDRLESVSHQVDLAPEKVRDLLEEIVRVLQTSQQKFTGQSVSTALEKLLNETPQVLKEAMLSEQTIDDVSKKTEVSQDKVKAVMNTVSQLDPHQERTEASIDAVSQKSNVSRDKVKGILANLAAAKLERTLEGKPKIGHKATVSVEDYEEVKNMWTNHYKLTEVPVSEGIKSREDWLNEDVRVLTNTLNMMTSLSPADKEKGMKQVAAILPFLLLGGFSELETVVYLKAKLAAAKQVLEQLGEREKIKEEVLKEEEETLIEIPQAEKKEEEKAMHLEEAMGMEESPQNTKGPATSPQDKPDEST